MWFFLNQTFRNISYHTHVYLARWTSHWVTRLSHSVPSVVSLCYLPVPGIHGNLSQQSPSVPDGGTWVSHQELDFLALPHPAAFLSKREVVLLSSSMARVLRLNHPLPCPIALWASDRLCRYSFKQFRCWGAHGYHILPTEPWLGLLSICWVMAFSFSAKGQIQGMSSTMSTMPTSSLPSLKTC